jgi:hypothetical protein
MPAIGDKYINTSGTTIGGLIEPGEEVTVGALDQPGGDVVLCTEPGEEVGRHWGRNVAVHTALLLTLTKVEG